MSKELEALKGIKQAIAEHLHKQTGVSIKKHFEHLQNDTEISIVEQALNELERLKKFKETFDNYELAKKQDFIAYENWLECEAELKKTYKVEEKMHPYKTPHERLLEMGYEYEEHKQGHRYIHKENKDYIDIDLLRNSYYHFTFKYERHYRMSALPLGTTLELSRILTQYLEEMK